MFMAEAGNRWLLVGGAGYIGSHTCLELLNSGHEVVVFDNFSNSNPEAIEQMCTITGSKFDKNLIKQMMIYETGEEDFAKAVL